jgi:hypothetical protein
MPLSKWEYQAGGTATCPACGAGNTVCAFPAMLAGAHAAQAETALEGEAACFDHPGKRAAAACSQCGRYVCALCAVALGGEVWCPTCVASRSGRARAANLETSRTLWDSVTFTLPLASLVIWPFTFLAAPAAIAIGIARWRRPLSLVRRTRWRLVAGIALGAAETIGWTWAIVYLLTQPGGGGG